MSRKQKIRKFKALEGELSGDIEGLVSTVFGVDRVVYVVNWDSASGVNGEFFIEVAQDGDENWTKLPFSPQVNIAGAEGVALIHISEITWDKMRPGFTDNSSGAGSGNLTVHLTGSTQGA